jgi:hypothetical protein
MGCKKAVWYWLFTRRKKAMEQDNQDSRDETLMDVWRLMHRLEIQRQQDPQAIMLLIQAYERILKRLRPDKDPLFYASIWVKLGLAYPNLLVLSSLHPLVTKIWRKAA